MEQDKVTGGVSVLCWPTASSAYVLWKVGNLPQLLGSGDRFLVHTGSVHGGFAVLLRTSCYEFVIMIPYCINMLDMKYACCRVDMCCVG